MIADPVVRNRATVGGNLAHGDPANDHPATMLALEAEIVVVGPQGERKIPVTSFFTDLFTTALSADEILTEIRIPIPPAGSGGAYFKLERKVGDFATAGVAAQLTVGKDGVCQRVGIGLTNDRSDACQGCKGGRSFTRKENRWRMDQAGGRASRSGIGADGGSPWIGRV